MPYGLTNANSFNDKKMERIQALFEKYSHRYDILLLQEVWGSWTSTVALHGLEFGLNHYYYVPRTTWSLVNNGLMILSKIPLINTSVYTFKNTTGLQWFIPNGVLHSRIALLDREIDLFVTHIHAGSLDTTCLNHRSKEIQIAQVVELKKFIDDIRRGGDYIVAGDFNTDSLAESITSETLIEYDLVKTVMNTSSLLETESPTTYPIGVNNFLTNPAFIGHRTCVDHVFNNIPDCKANSVDLSDDDLPISDHAGVEITMLRLYKPGSCQGIHVS
jgi:endonuclease/exonuclease/phosphatase family metal-dependent hydrolase